MVVELVLETHDFGIQVVLVHTIILVVLALTIQALVQELTEHLVMVLLLVQELMTLQTVALKQVVLGLLLLH